MASRVEVDPRAEPLLEKYMTSALPEFRWELRGLSKKLAKRYWARGLWSMTEEHVTFEWGRTQGLSDTDVEAVVVHEVAHGLFNSARSCSMGSLKDEQLSDRLARVVVPEMSRPFRKIADTQVVEMGRFFHEEEREALLKVLPYMLASLEPHHRETLEWFFYEYPGASLREVAKEVGVPKSTLGRWRIEAVRELRRKFG